MGFDEILGHKEAKKILLDEIEAERIKHAYLFSGEQGLGKKKLAVEFAKAIFCQNQKKHPCDNCIICKKVDHSNHADLTIVGLEDSNSIKIDQIRAMQQEVAYKPYESSKKVFIIEDADKMTLPAANSLLKTLEEPPEYAVIILLAREISLLLPTIISRCQQINFNRVQENLIMNFLKKQGCSDDNIKLYTALAAGSPGKADQLLKDEEFLANRSMILEFLIELPEKKAVNIFKEIKKMEDLIKDDFPLFNLISGWYRDIILYSKEKAEENQQIINKDYIEQIRSFHTDYSVLELINIIKEINRIEKYIEQNVNKALALQVLFLKICFRRV